MTVQVPSPCGTPSPIAKLCSLAVDPEMDCKPPLYLGAQPVDRAEQPMGLLILRVDVRLQKLPGKPHFSLPLRSDIGAFMYVLSTHISPERALFPAFSGILYGSAACRETCAFCAACLRVVPSESMDSRARI